MGKYFFKKKGIFLIRIKYNNYIQFWRTKYNYVKLSAGWSSIVISNSDPTTFGPAFARKKLYSSIFLDNKILNQPDREAIKPQPIDREAI